MDDNQTLMQTLLMDTDEDELTVTLIDTGGNLNLQEIKMVLPHFCPFLRK